MGSPGDLDELDIAVLRAIANWRLGPPNAGNRSALGMAAVEKVHLERGGTSEDWYRLKRRIPGVLETLVVGGYLDEETGEVTRSGRALLDR